MAFLCQFYEGYGQTECTAGCTMTLAGDWTAGTVIFSVLIDGVVIALIAQN